MKKTTKFAVLCTSMLLACSFLTACGDSEDTSSEVTLSRYEPADVTLPTVSTDATVSESLTSSDETSSTQAESSSSVGDSSQPESTLDGIDKRAEALALMTGKDIYMSGSANGGGLNYDFKICISGTKGYFYNSSLAFEIYVDGDNVYYANGDDNCYALISSTDGSALLSQDTFGFSDYSYTQTKVANYGADRIEYFDADYYGTVTTSRWTFSDGVLTKAELDNMIGGETAVIRFSEFGAFSGGGNPSLLEIPDEYRLVEVGELGVVLTE